MKQQTAMKQMVDYLEEMKSKTTGPSETYMLIDAWVKAIHLMQVEKEQIIEAYKEARNLGCKCYDDLDDTNAEPYYNQTYKDINL
jgi:hypothetical protein